MTIWPIPSYPGRPRTPAVFFARWCRARAASGSLVITALRAVARNSPDVNAT